MSAWNVIGGAATSSLNLSQHTQRLEVLRQVHLDERPVRGLELAQRTPRRWGLSQRERTAGSCARQKAFGLVRCLRVRLIHALQPQ